jgi:hypothetical protein
LRALTSPRRTASLRSGRVRSSSAALGLRVDVVELQLSTGRASLPVLGDEGALMVIAPGHRSLDVIGDMPRVVLLLDQPRLPRRLGLGVLLATQFAHQRVEGATHDLGQIAIRNLVTQESWAHVRSVSPRSPAR